MHILQPAEYFVVTVLWQLQYCVCTQCHGNRSIKYWHNTWTYTHLWCHKASASSCTRWETVPLNIYSWNAADVCSNQHMCMLTHSTSEKRSIRIHYSSYMQGQERYGSCRSSDTMARQLATISPWPHRHIIYIQERLLHAWDCSPHAIHFFFANMSRV